MIWTSNTNTAVIALLLGQASWVDARLDVDSVISSTSSCCTALTSALGPHKVSYPNSVSYLGSLASYYSLQEAQIRPNCIVLPRSARDVSDAVLILTQGARKWPGKCNFAVRGGGHTPNAGAANIKDGITIDLSGLNTVKVSNDQTKVHYGPGNRWVDIYRVLDRQNLSTSGGRVANVGVSGLLLGGGISFFSPRYGFACDNVERFEIVLANGTITYASVHRNSDLLRALRGGSNNFGIVTSITSKTFSQGRFWGGFIFNPISTRHKQFLAFEALTANPHYDPYAALINSYTFIAPLRQWTVGNNLEYTKDDPPTPYPEVFKPFTDLPQTLNTMRVSKLKGLALEIAALSGGGSRELWATTTYGNSATMMERFFDIANATAYNSLLGVPGLLLTISFQPFPKLILGKAAEQAPGNSLGLDPQEGNMFNVFIECKWNDQGADDRVETAVKAIINEANSDAKKMGLDREYLYLNYAADWQKPIAGYGKKNVEELTRVSQKYDPSRVFQQQVPGGFKLWD